MRPASREHVLDALLVALLLGSVSLGSACSSPQSSVPVADRAFARRITDAADLIGGPKASGQVGDLLLANTRVRFVVAAAGRTRAWIPVGGVLLDADRVRPGPGDDRLEELSTRLGVLRALHADTVEVANDGTDGRAAVVRVTGHDVAIPAAQAAVPLAPTQVTAVTEYRLEPYADSLEISTTVTDVGGHGAAFPAGDFVGLGDFVSLFAPGPGTDHEKLAAATDLRFLAAFGGDTSYGYVAPGRRLSVLAPALDVLAVGCENLTVPAHGSATFTRYLAVAETDVAALLPEIVRREGGDPARLATVAGTVTEQHTEAPVAGAWVEFALGAEPLAVAVSGADGRYRAPLERLRYDWSVTAANRLGVTQGPLDLESGRPVPAALDLQVSDTGRLALQVDDPAGAACAARVQLYRADGTPAGYLLAADGRGTSDLPPGDYRAVISRGYEWEAAEVSFSLAAGQVTTVAAVLERVVDSAGFIALDPHTHTAASPDSGLDPRERVAHALADGVEVVVTTDHDIMFDLAPTVAELGLAGALASAAGCELSPINGHLNGYPVLGGPRADTDGYWPVKWWREDAAYDYVEMLWPAALFAAVRDRLGAQVVQINHPRLPSLGLLDWVEYDPQRGMAAMDPARFDLNWDVIEVCNAGCDGSPDSADSRSLRDYYSFLNQGFVRGAVGVSDNHGSEAWLGRARTMVQVRDDDPRRVDLEEAWASLKAGRAVVLDGPFVVASVRDDAGTAAGPGDLARVTGAEVSLHVTVQAPRWIPTDRLTVVANGVEVTRVAIPTTGDPRPTVRFDADVPVGAPTRDTWYVVIVDGDTPMAPVLPGATPRSITNAIFVDRDGDGTFAAPGV